MESLAGHFLVASPHLPDENFYKTVVLLLRHDEEGAFGVVLTRPLPSTIADIWKALGLADITREEPVYLGGPVNGPLMALHCEPNESEGEVAPGVYFATSRENLNHLVEKTTRPLRIFSGYSGWGEGQLESELEEGSWFTTPASLGEVFSTADDLWKSVANRIGFEVLLPTRGKSIPIPPNPELN